MNPLLTPLVLSAALLCADLAQAAAGDLDPGFGRGGRVSISFDQDVSPTDVALLPGGKILVSAGFSNTPFATQAFGVVRLHADGRLDRRFGRDGVAWTAFTNFVNTPNAMAVQPDGKILVAGTATSADGTLSEFALARFDRDGSADPSFGGDGRVTTNFVGVKPGGVSNPATAVLLQPDGRIVVAGLASECADCLHQTALARYHADGRLDASFGNGGLVTAPAIGSPHALALLSNGHLLALNGHEVAEFTERGVWTTVLSTTTGSRIVRASHVQSSMFQRSGRFFQPHAALGPISVRDIDVQLASYMPLGNLNVEFASPIFGFAHTPLALTDTAQAIAIAPDGRIVLGGIASTGLGETAFGVARINADASLDDSFGEGGSLTTDFSSVPGATFSFVNAIAVQPDGRIVAVGLTGTRSGHTRLSLARYLGE